MSRFLEKRRQTILILILGIIGIAFFVFAGQEWVSLEDDSVFYMNPSRHEGVMPIYPLFLFGLKVLCGEAAYLGTAVVIQSLLAVLCTIIFALYLRKQFQLREWETILVYIACLLPFSIYLPKTGITHQILTEGLSYSLFYIFFLFLSRYFLFQKYKDAILAVVFAMILSLLRSQLLFLFPVIYVIVLLTQFMKKNNKQKLKKAVGVIAYGIAGALIMLLFVILVYKLYGKYVTTVVPQMQMWVQEAPTVVENKQVQSATAEKPKKQSTEESMSQFISLIMIRGGYEADAEDEQLFASEEMKEIFRRFYQVIDENQCRYVYARQDLYIWKDLVQDYIINVARTACSEYIQENPDSNLSVAKTVRSLGMTLLLHHFDRYLYHTWRLMISGFISSVFFQIDAIYLLCHFITLFLYLFAIGGSIWCKKHGGSSRAVRFMSVTLIYLVMMVSIISVIFIGLQRYMVYAMGIFYCGLYLMVKELLLLLHKKYPQNRLLTPIAGVLTSSNRS